MDPLTGVKMCNLRLIQGIGTIKGAKVKSRKNLLRCGYKMAILCEVVNKLGGDYIN